MKPHWKIKGKQIGLVHVAKAQLIEKGVLTEESYRDCLATYGNGAKSSTELTVAQLDELMKHFTACGFVYRPKVKKAPKIRATQRTKQVYLAAIGKLLNDLGQDWSYAEGIARQMFTLDKDDQVVWQWFSPEQLHKVQISLIYEVRKQAGDKVTRKPETLARRKARSSARG